jgi:hypothetical protein
VNRPGTTFATILASLLGLLVFAAGRTQPVASCDAEDYPNELPCVWISDEDGNGRGRSYYRDEEGNQTWLPSR